MFSNDLCLNLIGIDIKMMCQMNAESQAVQEGASARNGDRSRPPWRAERSDPR
jgi:hypothetical protein